MTSFVVTKDQVSDAVVAYLQAGNVTTARDLAETVAPDLGVTVEYVERQISGFYLAAEGAWKHVHRDRPLGGRHGAIYRYDVALPARRRHEPVQQRWQSKHTIDVVMRFLRANRGVPFTADMLRAEIGFPGQPGSLRSLLSEAALHKRGVIVGKTEGRRGVMTWMMRPVAVPAERIAAAVACSAVTPSASADYVGANHDEWRDARETGVTLAPIVVPEPEPVTVVAPPEGRLIHGWEAIGEHFANPAPTPPAAVEVIHRDGDFMLVRTADGVLWECEPFKRAR